MLSQHILDQLQPYDFDRLAHKEQDGRRRLRLIAHWRSSRTARATPKWPLHCA
ncbi:hypothetical protein POHY109586_21670 [Polaromonas hydrogenivorans]